LFTCVETGQGCMSCPCRSFMSSGPAGTFWQDPLVGGSELSPTPGDSPVEAGGLLSAGKSGKSRPVTVAYVVNGEASQQNNAESMALQCLKHACDRVGSKLDTVNFSKLDFGETTVLDRFYNAGESSVGNPNDSAAYSFKPSPNSFNR
ncbi:hypothetical protein GOODEAATRI_000748, partial [Goodea atripinnis]